MSLLKDAGHPTAHRYPIGMVFDEAALVVERRNSDQATATALLQLAVASILDKKAGKKLGKTLKDLQGSTVEAKEG